MSKTSVCSTFNRAVRILYDKANWLIAEYCGSNPIRSVAQQKRYIAALGSPKSDFERSYLQYKCQMFLAGRTKCAFFQAASLPVLCFLIFKYIFCPQSLKKTKPRDMAAVFNHFEQNILPNSLKQSYAHIKFIGASNSLFDNESKRFFFKNMLRVYPFSWYFLAKCMIKMTQYSFIVNNYHPKAIITSNEYSFTSSFITAWCACFGVEHINVMHGEKAYDIRDSFFKFNCCFVWHEYYEKLFISLKADKAQFITELPPALILNVENNSAKQIYDFTYYEGFRDKKQLLKTAKLLYKLKNMGYTVAYRRHPRDCGSFSKELFKNLSQEDPKTVSLEASLSATKHAVATHSTVLYQAYLNGVSVVIDDLSNPRFYNHILEANYIMTNLKHERLSDYLGAKTDSGEGYK